jgi:hypothetical protein
MLKGSIETAHHVLIYELGLPCKVVTQILWLANEYNANQIKLFDFFVWFMETRNEPFVVEKWRLCFNLRQFTFDELLDVMQDIAVQYGYFESEELPKDIFIRWFNANRQWFNKRFSK